MGNSLSGTASHLILKWFCRYAILSYAFLFSLYGRSQIDLQWNIHWCSGSWSSCQVYGMELQWKLDGYWWWWGLDKVNIYISDFEDISYGILFCSIIKDFNVVMVLGRYWQNNMNNVKANKSAHEESVRDLRYVIIVSRLD